MGLAAATVARYNELAQKGVDEDYGKEAYRLRPITQAPFYGYFMGGSLLCTCDGLRINDKCQVYDTNHKTIGGLYGSTYWTELGYLCIFLIASLFLGLILRKPIIKLNEKINEKLAGKTVQTV